MNIRQRINSQKGFTLIELMVVIAILGILAALVLPKLSGSNDAAKNGRMIADLRTIDGALNMYYSQNQSYSGASISGLKNSGFLNSIPKDAKNAEFSLTNLSQSGYQLTGNKTNGASIKSPGSDGYDPANDK